MSDPRVVTTLDAFRAAVREFQPSDAADDASTTRGGLRVPVEVQVTVSDPFLAYRRPAGPGGTGGVFLETTGGQPGWGYSGVDAIDRFSVGPDAVSRTGGDEALGERAGMAIEEGRRRVERSDYPRRAREG